MSIVDEVITALETAMPATDIFDGHVPVDPPANYLVVYTDPGALASLTVDGDLIYKDLGFQFRYVGANRASCEAICNAARTVFMGKSFTSGGWRATFDPDYSHTVGTISPDDSIPGRVVMTSFDSITAQCHRI